MLECCRPPNNGLRARRDSLQAPVQNLIENGFPARPFDLPVRTGPSRYCSRISAQRVPALIDDLPHQRLVLRLVSQPSSRSNQPRAHPRPPHNAATRPQAAAWKNSQTIDASNNVFKLARPFDIEFPFRSAFRGSLHATNGVDSTTHSPRGCYCNLIPNRTYLSHNLLMIGSIA